MFENGQTTVNERIVILIKELTKGNKSEFARLIGISNQSLSEIVGSRQSAPSFATLQKLFIAFPQVSMPWLILGKEAMIVENHKVATTKEGETIDSLQSRLKLLTEDAYAEFEKYATVQLERESAEAQLHEARALANDETPQGKAVLMACEMANRYILEYYNVIRGQVLAKRMMLADLHYELATLLSTDTEAMPHTVGTSKLP
jgi:transcriptional regulator with XRE-family HTH domain